VDRRDYVEVGPSKAEPFWTKFLRSLTRRGLRGVKLIISDALEGLKASAGKVLSSTWQRCRVHFMRNALAHVGPSQRPMVAPAIRTAFTQETAEAAHQEWRAVEQNDEWAVTRRHMTLETLDGLSDDATKPRKIAAA
jgi:putative transposase